MAHDGNTQRDATTRLPEPGGERAASAGEPQSSGAATSTSQVSPPPASDAQQPVPSKPLPKFNTIARPGDAKKPASTALALPPPLAGSERSGVASKPIAGTPPVHGTPPRQVSAPKPAAAAPAAARPAASAKPASKQIFAIALPAPPRRRRARRRPHRLPAPMAPSGDADGPCQAPCRGPAQGAHRRQRRCAVHRRPDLRPAAEAVEPALHDGCRRLGRVARRRRPAGVGHAGARDRAQRLLRRAGQPDHDHRGGHHLAADRPVLVPGAAGLARAGTEADVLGHDRGGGAPGRARPRRRAVRGIARPGGAPSGLVHERGHLARARTGRRARGPGPQRGGLAREVLHRERAQDPRPHPGAGRRAPRPGQHHRQGVRDAEGDGQRGAHADRQAVPAADQARQDHRGRRAEPDRAGEPDLPPPAAAWRRRSPTAPSSCRRCSTTTRWRSTPRSPAAPRRSTSSWWSARARSTPPSRSVWRASTMP